MASGVTLANSFSKDPSIRCRVGWPCDSTVGAGSRVRLGYDADWRLLCVDLRQFPFQEGA